VDLIRVISTLAAISAGLTCNPDAITDTLLSRAAALASYLNTPSPSSSSSSSDFLSSALSSAATFVDKHAYKLRWRQQLHEFDQYSPVDHRMVVRVMVAMVVLGGTRVLCRSMLK
jgi:hypothetical protein